MKLTQELMSLNEQRLEEQYFSPGDIDSMYRRFQKMMQGLEQHMEAIGHSLRKDGNLEKVVKSLSNEDKMVEEIYKMWAKMHDALADLEQTVGIAVETHDEDEKD